MPDDGIELSPNFFLATGWQTTAFSCADYGSPWTESPTPDPGGCLAIQRPTTWAELTVLYPSIYDDESAFPQAFSGDSPEASTLALAWSTVGAHALWARPGVDRDPAEFYADSADPHAAAIMAAMIHIDGPWSAQVANAVQQCPDNLAACAPANIEVHVRGVLDKMDALDAAPCLETELTAADIDAHVDSLMEWWPPQDWDAARAAAQDARAYHEGEGLQRQVNPVLNALDASLDTRLGCPEERLWSVYRYSCP